MHINHVIYRACVARCSVSGGASINFYMVNGGYGDKELNTNWKICSGVYKIPGEISEFTICLGYSPSVRSGTVYVDRVMVVDLTDTFGAGNEPTAEWCDKNIIQWSQQNYSGVNAIQLFPKTTFDNVIEGSLSLVTRHGVGSELSSLGYLPLQNNYEIGSIEMTQRECYAYNRLPIYSMTKGHVYYTMMDIYIENFDSSHSYDVYWPEAEPYIGQNPIHNATKYNGGGLLNNISRYGFYNIRENWVDGVYPWRFDINHNFIRPSNTFLSNIDLYDVERVVIIYNDRRGDTQSFKYINREWCDRNLCGRNQGVIQIKDPKNKKIQFTPDGDIRCNDIEIDTKLNKVIFDGSTGTIKCKKLIKEGTN